MPIEIVRETHEGASDDQEIKNFLESADGKPTMEASVIENFLDMVNFDAVFQMEGMDEFIDFKEGYVKLDAESGEMVEAEEGEEGAELGVIATLSGETVAENVDVDDLVGMLENYILDWMPEDTLESRALKRIGMHVIGEEQLDEGPFKKGDFRKLHKRPGGKDAVARMLMAMMKKQSIQRAAGGPGSGYKKGDYNKDPAGYSTGTPSGIKKYRNFKKKNQAKISKLAKKAKGGSSTIAKFLGKPAGKKAKGKKKSIAASDQSPQAPAVTEATEKVFAYDQQLEGASLAAAMTTQMGAKKPATDAPKGD